MGKQKTMWQKKKEEVQQQPRGNQIDIGGNQQIVNLEIMEQREQVQIEPKTTKQQQEQKEQWTEVRGKSTSRSGQTVVRKERLAVENTFSFLGMPSKQQQYQMDEGTIEVCG